MGNITLNTTFTRIVRVIACIVLPIGSGNILAQVFLSDKAFTTEFFGNFLIEFAILFYIPLSILAYMNPPRPGKFNRWLILSLILGGSAPVMFVVIIFRVLWTHD